MDNPEETPPNGTPVGTTRAVKALQSEMSASVEKFHHYAKIAAGLVVLGFTAAMAASRFASAQDLREVESKTAAVIMDSKIQAERILHNETSRAKFEAETLRSFDRFAQQNEVMGAQLLEIAKTIGAREVIKRPPAAR